MNVALLSDSCPRALVTGLQGFTGYYLAQELRAAGYQVFGTAHGGEPVGEGIVTVDLCNREDLRQVVEMVRPQVVAHLAAISFVAGGDHEAMYRTNIVGTRNLLEALTLLNEKPRSVLLASSANIYGNAPVEVIDESVQPAPANDYAISKLAMEYLARLWMDRLPIVISRPFNYTGVGQAAQFLLPKIVKHFKNSEKLIELGNIDVERDFSDVRTVAYAYRRLLELSPSGDTFNVCSGVACSLSDVLAMMAEIAGYQIEVRVNPAFVRANDVQRLQGDDSKLRAVVGNLTTIPLKETLRWMYEA
jgi:nucleoside-diphosphate-sugar epimerase